MVRFCLLVVIHKASCSRSVAEHVGAVVVVLQCRMQSSQCRNDDFALLASADVKQSAPDSVLFCFSFPPPSDRRFGTNGYDKSVMLTLLCAAAEETMFT